jgi:hypothetical protein
MVGCEYTHDRPTCLLKGIDANHIERDCVPRDDFVGRKRVAGSHRANVEHDPGEPEIQWITRVVDDPVAGDHVVVDMGVTHRTGKTSKRRDLDAVDRLVDLVSFDRGAYSSNFLLRDCSFSAARAGALSQIVCRSANRSPMPDVSARRGTTSIAETESVEHLRFLS